MADFVISYQYIIQDKYSAVLENISNNTTVFKKKLFHTNLELEKVIKSLKIINNSSFKIINGNLDRINKKVANFGQNLERNVGRLNVFKQKLDSSVKGQKFDALNKKAHSFSQNINSNISKLNQLKESIRTIPTINYGRGRGGIPIAGGVYDEVITRRKKRKRGIFEEDKFKGTTPLTGIASALATFGLHTFGSMLYDFEAGLNEVQKAVDVTTEAMGDYRKSILNMAGKFSPTEVALTMAELSKAGLQGDLNRATQNMLRFAAAANLKPQEAVEGVMDLMVQTGTSSDKMLELMGQAAKIANETSTSLEQMLLISRTSAASMQKYGFKPRDLFALYGALAKGGEKTGHGGTITKRFFDAIMVSIFGQRDKPSRIQSMIGFNRQKYYDIRTGQFKTELMPEMIKEIQKLSPLAFRQAFGIQGAQVASILKMFDPEYYRELMKIASAEGAEKELIRLASISETGYVGATDKLVNTFKAFLFNWSQDSGFTRVIIDFEKTISGYFEKLLKGVDKIGGKPGEKEAWISPHLRDFVGKLGLLFATFAPISLGLGLMRTIFRFNLLNLVGAAMALMIGFQQLLKYIEDLGKTIPSVKLNFEKFKEAWDRFKTAFFDTEFWKEFFKPLSIELGNFETNINRINGGLIFLADIFGYWTDFSEAFKNELKIQRAKQALNRPEDRPDLQTVLPPPFFDEKLSMMLFKKIFSDVKDLIKLPGATKELGFSLSEMAMKFYGNEFADIFKKTGDTLIAPRENYGFPQFALPNQQSQNFNVNGNIGISVTPPPGWGVRHNAEFEYDRGMNQ